jgi:HAD superfamily hydrolase (TIGR01484 family)
MEQMKTKAIIFDLDGTAMPLGLGNFPSKRLVDIISRLQDKYYISVATGRSLNDAIEIIDFLGLKDECIISAGSEIYNPVSRKVVWQKRLSSSAVNRIKSALRGSTAKANLGTMLDADKTAGEISVNVNEETTVIYVTAMQEDDATKLEKELEHQHLHVISTDSFWEKGLKDLHIMAKDASKEHALAELLKIFQISKEESVVAGDGQNDIGLFNAGGLKIAMGNAVPELKELADTVIGDADSDGLAEYLETLILGDK